MKTLLLICLLIGSGSSISSLRAKRSVRRFGRMIACLTDKNAFRDYNGYGCWCGKGGNGTPVDGTDRCCYSHDHCYKALEDDGTCSTKQLYFKIYSYSRDNCDTPSASVSCGSGDSCGVGLCQCDKTAAECFRSATFNSAYRKYDKDNC